MSQVELRKLALAKYIFLHGCSHVNNRDEISRMLAIHHFDFAVEMVLKAIALKHNIIMSSKQDPRFKDLWNQLTQIGIKLPLKNEMFALHDERNLVQHSGIIPSFEAVTRFEASTERFLKDVIEDEFNISFDELSFSQLIANDRLRKLVEKAEKLFAAGKYKDCILACDEALIEAVFNAGDIFGKAGMLAGYFSMPGNEFIRIINEDYAEKYRDKDFYIPVKDLSRAIVQLARAATTMQFLDEYRVKFIKFRSMIKNLKQIPEVKLEQEARSALNFVTGLILKWQEEGVISSITEGRKP